MQEIEFSSGLIPEVFVALSQKVNGHKVETNYSHKFLSS